MDGHPTLVFKPVYKSFRFKTCEPTQGLKIEENTSLKDNNVFIAGPDSKDPEAVQSSHADEKWKAAMDYDLPELVAFLQDSGYEFVKDICIDSEVPSQNRCLEENNDLDSCIISSDAESSSESSVESEDSSLSSDSTVSKHISECKEDVSNQSGFENLKIEDGWHFGETDDSSSDLLTKETIAVTLLRSVQDPTKAVYSDSVALPSSKAIAHNRRSKNSLKPVENARRGEILLPSVECHSQNSSEDGMSDSITRSSKSKIRGKNARREVFPQTDLTEEDWMSVGIRGSSQSQQHQHENARRVVWPLSEEFHTQDSSEDEMSDSGTESSQSQQHILGESSSSVMYSGAIPSFGRISFQTNSGTTSSRSFTFPILSSEWIDSPVRMVEADQKQVHRHRRWGIRFLCCNF